MGKLRFKIVDGENVSFSEWVDEAIQHAGPQSTAAQVVAQLRKDHPNAALSIEREVVPPIQRPAMVRFKVDVGDNTFYFTRAVPESEANELRAKIDTDEELAKFKKKTVTREVVNG